MIRLMADRRTNIRKTYEHTYELTFEHIDIQMDRLTYGLAYTKNNRLTYTLTNSPQTSEQADGQLKEVRTDRRTHGKTISSSL